MSHGLPEWTICGRLGDEEKLHNCVDMVDSIDCMKRKKDRTGKDPQPRRFSHGLWKGGRVAPLLSACFENSSSS